jgi:V8-like Glu-specific endopeptidase
MKLAQRVALASAVMGVVMECACSAGIAGDASGEISPGENAAQSSQKIIGGTQQNVRWDVAQLLIKQADGAVEGCTGTLIADNYVLTAAHCFRYSPVLYSPSTANFNDSNPNTPFFQYPIDRLHIFGSNATQESRLIDGSNLVDDLALVHLGKPSFNAVFTVLPATISPTLPASGQQVTGFGYGCLTPGGATPQPIEAYVTYSWGGSTSFACPGDSGGPIVLGNATSLGPLFALYSGNPGGTDTLSGAAYYKEDIDAVMQSWTSAGNLGLPVTEPAVESGIDRPGMDYSVFNSTSASACLTSCITDSGCIAWGFDGTRCHLKLGVPDWQPCATCSSGRQMGREIYYDRPGTDYNNFTLPSASPEMCEAACGRVNGCTAYTYVAPSGGNLAHCWLKSGTPAPIANTNTVSGINRGFEVNVDRSGSDYKVIGSTQYVNDCKFACATDSVCKAYSYDSTNRTCHLKSLVPNVWQKMGIISGVKKGLEMNTNRPGDDYSNFDLAAPFPELCQADCANDVYCLGFTYVPPFYGGSTNSLGHCWLKGKDGNVPAPVYGEGLISGLSGLEFR